MNHNPRISILMGTYNRASIIDRAIESVLAQTFTDWELIIADDGSTDNTPAVVEEWQKKEPRIVYVRSAINQGISKNYNMGLRLARGEYIAMIDDDDAWIGADKLSRQVEFLDTYKAYAGCGGGVVVVDSAGREKYRYLKPEHDPDIRAYMLYSNPMANSTTLFRRSLGEEVGWYDETTRYSGDRDFWLKLGLKGKLYNFQAYFSYYTMGNANTSIAKMKPHLKASLMIMKRYRGHYPHYPSALILNYTQYAYAFLPERIRKLIHTFMAQLKRRVVR